MAVSWGRTGLEAVVAVGRSYEHRMELLSRKTTQAWRLTEWQRQRGSRVTVLGYKNHSSHFFRETGVLGSLSTRTADGEVREGFVGYYL